MKNKLYNQALYFMELQFDLIHDVETLELMNETRAKLEN
jgi:hypothetical protein